MSRTARWFWLIWAFLLAGTLVFPPTRETHICAMRAFFHHSDGKTYVTPGGHTHFTELYRRQREAVAGRSPDDFFVGGVTRPGIGGFPIAAAWENDPLLSWAAMESANRLHRLARDTQTQPATGADLKEQVDRALELVRRGQQMEPENGALWMAEAVVYFIAQDEPAAIQALRTSVQKRWVHHDRDVASRAQKLLNAEGVPRFDSATLHQLLACGPAMSLSFRASEYLAQPLRSAVERQDDATFTELLTLLRSIRDAPWTPPLASMMSYAHTQQELTGAMASSLGITLPRRDLSEPTITQLLKAEEDVWWTYLRSHAPALAETVIAEEPLRNAIREARGELRRRQDNDWMWRMVSAEASMELSVVLFAGLLVALLAGVPAALSPPQWTEEKKLRLGRGFILAMIPAYGLMFICMWSAVRGIDCESMCVLVSSDAGRPLLTRSQWVIIASALAAALPFLAMLSGPSGPRLFHACILITGCGYLVMVCVSAIVREQTVAALASTSL